MISRARTPAARSAAGCSTRVRDVMKRARPAVVPHDATLAQAVVEMSGKGMGMTAIVDARRDASPASSPTATCAAVSTVCATSAPSRVADVMTRAPLTIGPERLAIECVDLMEAPPKKMALLVVDDGRPPRRRAAHARSFPRPSRMTVETMPDDLAQRARGIRLLTCDVDGVLTDGRLYYGDDGCEMKAFSSLDGVGSRCSRASASPSPGSPAATRPLSRIARRALGVARLMQGTEDKLSPWERSSHGARLPDFRVRAHRRRPAGPSDHRPLRARRVGPARAVGVKRRAHYVTRRDGGGGAVREVCELILAAQGALDTQHAAFARTAAAATMSRERASSIG